jgi:hypothetical protein
LCGFPEEEEKIKIPQKFFLDIVDTFGFYILRSDIIIIAVPHLLFGWE